MLALDWHLEFPAPAAGSWDWIGIRAHRFQLAEGPGPYVFPYEVVHRIEDTFSYILQIRRQGDPGGQTAAVGGGESPASLHPGPGYVRVPPEEVLLLQN